ncbi:hypothetical protein C8Q76DRAFT_737578, partial [Earliella scabrosa]
MALVQCTAHSCHQAKWMSSMAMSLVASLIASLWANGQDQVRCSDEGRGGTPTTCPLYVLLVASHSSSCSGPSIVPRRLLSLAATCRMQPSGRFRPSTSSDGRLLSRGACRSRFVPQA